MTKGEGLVALLYAVKDLIETFAIMIITGVALIAFFWNILMYINSKRYGGNRSEQYKRNIVIGLVVLFVIFGIYSLIALTAAIFGVNASPSGGLLVR